MSQPPNQPPQGGFGAPQDPRQQPPQQPPQPPAQPPQMPPAPPGPPAQPGYGSPQAPPQQAPQPGYGYPGQQPGQQPGQAGPYGQPQPGPYGQPQPGPYGQQQPGPYGQPQPGPYGGFPGAPAPGTGGTGGGFKGKPAVIIGAVLAAVLVVGGGIYLAVSGDDGGKKKRPVAGSSNDNKQDGQPTGGTGDPSDDSAGGRDAGDDLNAGRQSGESKVLWLQKNDVDLPRNGADVYGPWFTDGLVVKAMYKKVAAYSTTDGKEKWSLPLSTEICAAPVRASDDGKIVIGVKNGTTEKAKCSRLQLVDLQTGKAGWQAEVKKEGTFDLLSDITIAISGNTVTAGRTGHSTAFSMKDGKELWGKLPGECQPYSFTSSAKLIAAAACSTGETAKHHERIQEHDPATGKVKWSYPLAKGWSVDKVYSVSPLVVSAQERAKKTWSIIALTDSGKLRSVIDGGKDKFQPQCGGSFVIFGRNLEGCTGVAADQNAFYMATAEKTTGLKRTNEVVAFNLDTGKPKWRSAATDRPMMPVRMEGGEVLVHMDASYDMGGALATIPASGGKPKTLLQNPQSTAEIENSFFTTKVAYEGGQFYVVASRVSAGNDEEEKETKTMMVFGK
ncbi:PQQ-binding-like beta-propeller repeat protein [Streptomyces sp. ISL-96]|uniref:outer membrane protein assembly factor BamB family protein n=1 Tax=Streptomyces sp. ISL-96 TaxID=2819191 RepID=UPI001BE5FCC0|nr:PQQ-binding-like beta-propeller repeat protein [Streptomyces sp. ISL-96]MBT2491761.1 PQQ-binding-like beta-propeller repeat protein [Streptomyces sp. ISL-96]